jgi:hypothetical protein
MSQIIQVKNSSYVNVSGNSLKQSFRVIASCEQSQEQNAKIQNDIISKLKSESSQTNQSVLSAVNSLVGEKNVNNVETAVKTTLNNNVLTTMRQAIASSINSSQSIIVEGSDHVAIRNNSMEASGDLISSVTQANVQQLSLIQAMNAESASKTEQVSKNPIADTVSAIGGVLSSLFSFGAMMFLLPFIIIVAIAVMFRKQIAGVICNIPTPVTKILCKILGSSGSQQSAPQAQPQYRPLYPQPQYRPPYPQPYPQPQYAQPYPQPYQQPQYRPQQVPMQYAPVR